MTEYEQAQADEMAKAQAQAEWWEVFGNVPLAELLGTRHPGESLEQFLRREWREICAVNHGPDYDAEAPYDFRRWARQIEREISEMGEADE